MERPHRCSKPDHSSKYLQIERVSSGCFSCLHIRTPIQQIAAAKTDAHRRYEAEID
jgi:hypothetical protein